MSEALIIVDFQRDFTHPDGALAVPQGDEIADRLNDFAQDDRYELVLATRDWHPPTTTRSRSRAGPGRCTACATPKARNCTPRSTSNTSTRSSTRGSAQTPRVTPRSRAP